MLWFKGKLDDVGLRPRAVPLFLCITLLPFAVLGAEHRIQLKPGQNSVTIEGRFPRDGKDQIYVLNARAGQHLRINMRPVGSRVTTAGQVKSPSGKYDGGPGGVIFDSALTETGDYQVRISERQNRIAGKFFLEVELR
jgi:hypothetical protein